MTIIAIKTKTAYYRLNRWYPGLGIVQFIYQEAGGVDFIVETAKVVRQFPPTEVIYLDTKKVAK